MKKRQLPCRLQGQIRQPLLLTPPFNHPFPYCHIAVTLSSCLCSLTADKSLLSGFITVFQFILCYLVWKAAEINSDSWKSKYEFFMVLKVKESASSDEAFLPILVDVLGATVHFFEPDHHFFFNSLILKFYIHCSVHCAHPSVTTCTFCLGFYSYGSFFVLEPCHPFFFKSTWDTVLFSCLDFSSSTCCNHILIANIR